MLQTYNYQTHAITFDFGNGNEMINATQMAKPFGKLVYHYLENEQTKNLIDVLTKSPDFPIFDKVQARNSELESLENEDFQSAKLHSETINLVVKVVHGGRNNGTWMHRILALNFAAWLSPEFHLWTLKQVDNILLGKRKLRDDMAVLSSRRRTLQEELTHYEKILNKDNNFVKYSSIKKELSQVNKKINFILDDFSEVQTLFE